jgi:hypothetical protein
MDSVIRNTMQAKTHHHVEMRVQNSTAKANGWQKGLHTSASTSACH